MNNHIMIDIETLSSQTDAHILSIGAALFSKEGIIKTFYRETMCADQGRHISPQTIAWWMTQPEEARDVLSAGGGDHLDACLIHLGTFVRSVGGKPCVWANPAQFDLSILRHAHAQLELDVPWHYRQERCFRTAMSLSDVPVGRVVPGVPHNAREDAVAQADSLILAEVKL